jgi:hypothetical protein
VHKPTQTSHDKNAQAVALVRRASGALSPDRVAKPTAGFVGRSRSGAVAAVCRESSPKSKAAEDGPVADRSAGKSGNSMGATQIAATRSFKYANRHNQHFTMGDIPRSSRQRAHTTRIATPPCQQALRIASDQVDARSFNMTTHAVMIDPPSAGLPVLGPLSSGERSRPR